jgi:UPF0716 family protein affecting phage T7 exclusion
MRAVRTGGTNHAAFSFRHIPRPSGSTDMPEAALLNPIIALIAGILILIVPRLLNYVVAIYLILVGILGILPFMS